MPLVRSYVRSDGTRVRAHARWAPGAKRETMIFGAVALAVVGLGNSNVSAGEDGTPQPKSTVQYPIRFDHAPAARAPQPRPTVSYPIRWQR
ncbi:hypothetical protein B1H29_36730 [Streptomyces pactum]|uniref:Uncharacterized protein n=2 Tax=Streptomyces pactum TaxID=68249 RepID=A0A1S6JIS5_9ACTN|nr:hypothetical protein B1H29_00330 [Streptomyces pactum]AQS71646.1 hypothetical protein B1H29_36730 [Streptomyces pactum]